MDEIAITFRGEKVTAKGTLMSIYRDEDSMTVKFKVVENPCEKCYYAQNTNLEDDDSVCQDCGEVGNGSSVEKLGAL